MADFTIRSPLSDLEWENYDNFRWEVLRKPLELSHIPLKDNLEDISFHFMGIDGDANIVSCGRVHLNNSSEAQIRYMGVDSKYRRMRLGSAMINKLEAEASLLGAKKVILNAREEAIKFYKSLILTCPFAQLKKLSKKYIKHSFIKQKVKMDANITVMMVTKKMGPPVSSYFFSDPILGWAAYENSKKRFKSNYDLWTLQSTYKWANKIIDKNNLRTIKLKNNDKIEIVHFIGGG